MSDRRTSRRVVLTAVGELATIVLGVLLAFQVDEWRENREEIGREQAHLRALRQDFEENLSELRRIAGVSDRILTSQRTLLEASVGAPVEADLESLKTMVNASVQYARVEPVTGAYDALVASGDLRLIRNDELRGALSRFAGLIRREHENEQISQLLRAQQFAALTESTDFLSVMRDNWRERTGFPRSAGEPDIEAVLENQDYVSHMAMVGAIESYIRDFYLSLAEDAELILALIDEELN